MVLICFWIIYVYTYINIDSCACAWMHECRQTHTKIDNTCSSIEFNFLLKLHHIAVTVSEMYILNNCTFALLNDLLPYINFNFGKLCYISKYFIFFASIRFICKFRIICVYRHIFTCNKL